MTSGRPVGSRRDREGAGDRPGRGAAGVQAGLRARPSRPPVLSLQMSGAIFGSLEGLSSLDAPSVHPLVCPLCHVQYERPCLLDCFHDFCAGCLRGRATEGRLTCPLCQ